MPVIRINKQGYEALQHRHNETGASITYIASQAIIEALKPKKRSNPELKKSKSDPRLQEMKRIFFESWEANNGFKPINFGAVDVSHLKQIIRKLDNITDVTNVTQLFSVIMTNLPEWYKRQSLKVINSKLDELIAEIKQRRIGEDEQARQYYGF